MHMRDDDIPKIPDEKTGREPLLTQERHHLRDGMQVTIGNVTWTQAFKIGQNLAHGSRFSTVPLIADHSRQAAVHYRSKKGEPL